MDNIIISNRWIATVASIWIQATMGGSYAFGVYSPVLKSSQSYDQSTLDTVSVFKDIGANAGVISGLLYASITASSRSRRWSCLRGPWVVLAAGAAQCFLGYFFMWLAVVGLIPRPPVPLMCLFMFLAAHAQTFFSTANVVTGVLNFPDYSGTIVGILKGFLGLTGAITIQVYQAFFKGNQSTFILILALLPTLVTFSVMCLVRICPGSSPNDRKYLNHFSVVALAIAAFLMINIIAEHIIEFPRWAHVVTVAFLFLLLSWPLKIALEAATNDRSYHVPTEGGSLAKNMYANETEINEEYVELASTSNEIQEVEESMNIVQALQSLNFWLLFVSMSCGMGSGLATVNNMSQIGQSLGYDSVKLNTLVSLWSIWNFLGRFGAGYISDILLRQKGWPRPLLIAITLATMTAGHLIISFGFPGNLYIGTILVGICYGAQWCLMPTITAEIFGVLHMGTIFNTIGIASPIGTYFLSVWVIGRIYDKQSNEDMSCYGVKCFMASFMILAFVSFVGFLVALTLFFRTREFYKSVVLRRLRIL